MGRPKLSQQKTMYPYPQTKKKYKLDHSGIDNWDMQDQAIKHPYAIFIKCRCNSKNPLGIMNATKARINEAITESFTYSTDKHDWIPHGDIGQIIEKSKWHNYYIQYIKFLDNKKNRLMVICLNVEQTPPGFQPMLFEVE